MPISSNFTSVFSKDWEINFTQCDPNGNLKYTELCNLLQLTAAAHSEVGGISFSDMQTFHQAWVLSRMRLEISELPKWKSIVTVKTWINSLEDSRSVRAIEVFCNGNKIAGSETFWVVFNTETRRPEKLALHYSHFEIFPEKLATENRFSKINTAFESDLISEKIVVLSDLDIVNHVNNVKYLEWCLDLIPENKLLKSPIHSIEMNFLKELSLNDAVIITGNIDLNATAFCISKEDRNCFALLIDWK